MTMDKQFFDKNEARDFKILTKLNEDIDFVKSFDNMPYKHCMDASGETDMCKVMMELKNRTCHITSFDDVYIESKKAAYLYFQWVTQGFFPLYINFFNNNKKDEYPEMIAIWRLDKLSTFNYHPKTKTASKGYQKDEYRERFGLLPVDAVIYKLVDNKYAKIKNIGETYMGR